LQLIEGMPTGGVLGRRPRFHDSLVRRVVQSERSAKVLNVLAQLGLLERGVF
jgi:hypothetical protein